MWRFKLIMICDTDGNHYVVGRVPQAIGVDVASFRLYQACGPYVPVSFLELLPVEGVGEWMRARQNEGFVFEAADRDSPSWKGIVAALQSPTEFLADKWHDVTETLASVLIRSEGDIASADKIIGTVCEVNDPQELTPQHVTVDLQQSNCVAAGRPEKLLFNAGELARTATSL